MHVSTTKKIGLCRKGKGMILDHLLPCIVYGSIIVSGQQGEGK
jgi:hypothetical protein